MGYNQRREGQRKWINVCYWAARFLELFFWRLRWSSINSNAHLWFQRHDLVAEVNKLLAEHYGEVVGNIKNVPSKNWFILNFCDSAAASLPLSVPGRRERTLLASAS